MVKNYLIILLSGGLKQHFKGYVDWKTAIVFGVPRLEACIACLFSERELFAKRCGLSNPLQHPTNPCVLFIGQG